MSTAAPPVIEYASPVFYPQLHPACLSAARWMIVLALLSGACVGVCFINGTRIPGREWVHLTVFAATIAVAVRAGMLLAQAGERGPLRAAMDLVAGVGLAGVGLAPLLLDLQAMGLETRLLLGPSFALMAVTTCRHLLMYRMLARWGRTVNRSWVGLSVLGAAKFAYEGIWLTCCSAPLLFAELLGDLAIFLLLGALYGCVGYIGIWIWMLVAHVDIASSLAPRQAAGR